LPLRRRRRRSHRLTRTAASTAISSPDAPQAIPTTITALSADMRAVRAAGPAPRAASTLTTSWAESVAPVIFIYLLIYFDQNKRTVKLIFRASWMEQGRTSHSTQNRSFRRRSSHPISWLSTEQTKPKQAVSASLKST